MSQASERNLEKAAQCGEPSYVWRDGQERRLQMILHGLGECVHGRLLENGCGIGMYVEHLLPRVDEIVGLEFDFERALEAGHSLTNGQTQHVQIPARIVNGAGERLPFPAESFQAILSHEVLEHVQDDRQAVHEMVRVLEPGGRIALFVPNRGYPFETHGIYWRGRYHFGNIPLVNWLPRRWRNRLAPHVRVYGRGDLLRLFDGLPVKILSQATLFGAYDNIIARWPGPGRLLRRTLQFLEKTGLRTFGLSHFWIVEKKRL
jgi:SAM-dependent methyltransferase